MGLLSGVNLTHAFAANILWLKKNVDLIALKYLQRVEPPQGRRQPDPPA